MGSSALSDRGRELVEASAPFGLPIMQANYANSKERGGAMMLRLLPISLCAKTIQRTNFRLMVCYWLTNLRVENLVNDRSECARCRDVNVVLYAEV